MNQFYIGQIRDRLIDVVTENRLRHNWYILSLLNHTLWITSMANILSRLNTLITFHRKKEKIAFLSLFWMQFIYLRFSPLCYWRRRCIDYCYWVDWIPVSRFWGNQKFLTSACNYWWSEYLWSQANAWIRIYLLWHW